MTGSRLVTPPRIEIISASAGSGKTYRLATVLHDAIADGSARSDAVLATTFTNRAAAELKERTRTRLLQSGRVQDAHRLGAARIGTVNAVCGRLVADFAFELGLAPDLRVIDERAAAVALRQAMSRVVTADDTDVRAKSLILATGMDYAVPDVPGFREHWGGQVFHCPFCHGW